MIVLSSFSVDCKQKEVCGVHFQWKGIPNNSPPTLENTPPNSSLLLCKNWITTPTYSIDVGHNCIISIVLDRHVPSANMNQMKLINFISKVWGKKKTKRDTAANHCLMIWFKWPWEQTWFTVWGWKKLIYPKTSLLTDFLIWSNFFVVASVSRWDREDR